jgi:hypothetical protein
MKGNTPYETQQRFRAVLSLAFPDLAGIDDSEWMLRKEHLERQLKNLTTVRSNSCFVSVRGFSFIVRFNHSLFVKNVSPDIVLQIDASTF